MIKEIQQVLKDNNLYIGAIDGAFGLESLRAIQNMPYSVVCKIQTILKQSGHYKGEIDGGFGAQSYKALNSLIPAPILTPERLKKIYPTANTAFVKIINENAKEWGIVTKAQLCLFLANIIHESGGFNALRENFNYSAVRLHAVFRKYFPNLSDARYATSKGQEYIANKVYGGRLGNMYDGDGWRYRGGGLIQTTGRYNYSMVGKAIKEDLVNYPAKITDPLIATKSAMHFWSSNDCGLLADRMEIKACRKKINGGYNGLDEVNTLFLKSWAILF